MTREEKVKAVAQYFMKDDPAEYADETLEQVMDQIRQTSDSFLDFTLAAYFPEVVGPSQ